VLEVETVFILISVQTVEMCLEDFQLFNWFLQVKWRNNLWRTPSKNLCVVQTLQ